jgi:DNA modification methylase
MIRKEIIGRATLYLGDCREIISELAFDCIVSDPPYGIAWKRGANSARNSKSHAGIANDQDTSARDAIIASTDVPTVMFGSFYAAFPEKLKQVLVWHKPADSGLVGSVTGFRRDCEPIFLIGKWPTRTVETSSVLRTIAGQAGTVAETGHPHTKPVGLMQAIIRMTPGQVVLDPFMGSGSTGVAAVQMQRSFVGVEIDHQYFDIACKRIEDAQRQGNLFGEAA